jgi:hypothetical protein
VQERAPAVACGVEIRLGDFAGCGLDCSWGWTS